MSKYSTIADKLKEEMELGKYDGTGKLPTEYELASSFDVSRQTIRQAISSLKAEGLVYQVQGSGTYVSKTQPSAKKGVESAFKNIFVICTYISEYIFPSIIRGIEATLNGTGYRINIAATGNKVDLERKILADVIKLRECDGIIVEGSKTGFPNPNIALYEEIEKLGIPIVFLHCSYPELPGSVVVGMDDRAGGRIAVERLIKSGCKKILGIFKSDDRQGLMRYAGFSDGLISSGFGLDNAELRWYTTEDIADHGMTIDKGMIAVLVKAGIDGVVCYNDQIATAIIRDFTRAGVKVPKLISFDNSYLCESASIPFESLGHRKEELGVIAATKIRNMIDGKKESSTILDWVE
jgi:GntR family transcriptional regulator of arabinose operon